MTNTPPAEPGHALDAAQIERIHSDASIGEKHLHTHAAVVLPAHLTRG
jgi:hypothetical protein